MNKQALLLSAFLLFPGVSYASDDMLSAAMKRIKQLEAENKAQATEIRRLKTGAPIHAKGNQITSRSKAVATTNGPGELPPAPSVAFEKEPSLAGFYGGINGGYGGGDIATSLDTFDFFRQSSALTNYTRSNSVSRFGGPLAGAQAGYNYFMTSGAMLGGEVDVDWSDASTKGSGASAMISDGNGVAFMSNDRYGLRWIGTARARVGYKLGSIVPYVSGGLAFGETSALSGLSNNQNALFYIGSIGSMASGNKVSAGWAVGAGIEYSVTDNISLKTEYLYTSLSGTSFFGSTSHYSAIPAGITLANFPPAVSSSLLGGTNSTFGLHQVRFGINYHLHLGDTPSLVAAKF